MGEELQHRHGAKKHIELRDKSHQALLLGGGQGYHCGTKATPLEATPFAITTTATATAASGRGRGCGRCEELDSPGGDGLATQQTAHQRRLAGTGPPEDRRELAWTYEP